MPIISTSILNKILGTFFLTAYTGIGVLAGIGVVSSAKNIYDEKKTEDEAKGK